MGTTTTRVWLVDGEDVMARSQAPVGVRDTAREGSPQQLKAALARMISDVGDQAARLSKGTPSHLVAAGMITSPLGLLEVPHVEAPAGIIELAAAAQNCSLPDVTDLPILLIPGVRCGPVRCDISSVGMADVIRGEETLCVGLVKLGLLPPESTLLNLGSHWKAIRLAADGRILSSITSISGELIHAAQTQTILASSVSRERPGAIDEAWMEAGMKEQRQSGLPLALFCVRLLEQRSDGNPEQRLAFLIGAFIAADLDALMTRNMLSDKSGVVIAGPESLASAWQHALARVPISAVTLSEAQLERAFLEGLRSIWMLYKAGSGLTGL
jgi:2-dehydro-3-deoxygalactonokinase